MAILASEPHFWEIIALYAGLILLIVVVRILAVHATGPL
jgi:hypothetical protein